MFGCNESVDDGAQMTLGEWKFALTVESVLNRIPEPEYRQLLVEAMMVLTLVCDHDVHERFHFNRSVEIDAIVYKANEIFLDEQVRIAFWVSRWRLIVR